MPSGVIIAAAPLLPEGRRGAAADFPGKIDHLLPEIRRPEEKQTVFAGAPTAEEFDNITREFRQVMKTLEEYTLRESIREE